MYCLKRPEGHQTGEHPNDWPKIVFGHEGRVEGEGCYFLSHARNRSRFRLPRRADHPGHRDVFQRGEVCARGEPSRRIAAGNVYDGASHVVNHRGRDFDKSVEFCPILGADQPDRAESVVPARRGPRPSYERTCRERSWFVVEEIDDTVDEFWWKLPLDTFSLRVCGGHSPRLDGDPIWPLGGKQRLRTDLRVGQGKRRQNGVHAVSSSSVRDVKAIP